MKRWVWLALVVVLACTAAAEEVARPREERMTLPPAWQGVDAQTRLLARRAAEVDADRRLVERIYGLRIDAQTTVLDLVQVSDEIRGALDEEIKGVRTTEVAYNDDMIVEVVREVTVREVIETIKRTITRTKAVLGVSVDTLEEITRETRDTVLAVMGNGAVPGTRGERRVQAKRAAEMDAFRKLAEKIAGVEITGETTVENLALASDHIVTALAAGIKGAKTTDIVYRQDDSCDVTMELVLREVIDTLQRTYRRYDRDGRVSDDQWRKVSTEVKDKVIEVVGSGAPRAQGAESVGASSYEPYSQEIQIIRRVIEREVGVL